MKDANYNAALDLLDLELIDVRGRHCGRADEIELAGEPGGELVIDALLVGRGAWRTRLPRWLHWLADGEPVRIPWSDVKEIGSAIRLEQTDRQHGLNEGELRPARWIRGIPGA